MTTSYETPSELIDVAEVAILAGELFKNDTDAAKAWMNESNELLFNDTPYELCLRGEAGFLINWLRDRLGKEEVK